MLKKYLDNHFSQFLKQIKFCINPLVFNTTQQNGIAEHKNRHFFDIAKTLLFHRQVPKEFWNEAILTTCYLINYMPSSVLQNKIPYFIMYPDIDLLPLASKIFGSLCFVHNHSPKKTWF